MRFNRGMYKRSLEVGEPGFILNHLSNRLGRVNTALNPVAMTLGFHRALMDPAGTPERRKKHLRTAKDLAKAEPEALQGTVLRLGAPNLFDDLIWRKPLSHEKDPQWYNRIGGRLLQNSKVSLPLRILGIPTVLYNDVITSATRAPHYNPLTDVVHNMYDITPVTQHEIGHAIDFNKKLRLSGVERKILGSKADKFDDWITNTRLGRHYGRLRRDAYTFGNMLSAVPGLGLLGIGLTLKQEASANAESRAALKKVLSKKRFREEMDKRVAYLPAGYGSYLGDAIGQVVAPAVPQYIPPTIGAVVGKGIGYPIHLYRKRKARQADEAAKNDRQSSTAKKRTKSDKSKQRKEKSPSRRHAA